MHCLNQCTATEGGERKARKNILSNAFSYQNPLWSRAISPSWGVAHMFSYSLLCSPFEKDSSFTCYTCVCFTSASLLYYYFVNPLSPNSDQHQFSPNNIHRLSSATSMRLNQMITKRRISDLLSIAPNLLRKEMYRDQFGEFVCGY